MKKVKSEICDQINKVLPPPKKTDPSGSFF